MFEQEKNELIKTGQALKENNLISLSGGNVSCRVPGDKFLVTPSGMAYEGLLPEDIVTFDIDGNVIEGSKRPSVDSLALLHVYRNMDRVNAIIHTHQPYATAVGMVYDKIPFAVTTLANAVAGLVNVAPFSSAASLAMGEEIINNIGDANAVILKNHGVITVGSTIKGALYAAVYMEDALKTFFIAQAMGTPQLMTDTQYQEAIEVFKDYGQKK
jgi:L-ribulose-5-phosphate 4-epimerase